MIPPKITQLPPAPVRSDAPVDFSIKADAMVGALQPFANEANILAEFVNTRADNAAASASTVAGVQAAVSADRVLSQQAASNAAGSAAAALLSANNASGSAGAAQLSANASEASAVRAEDAAQYVEGITDGAAPLNNPNFTGVVKVNDVPLGTAATANITTSNIDGTAGRVLKVGDFGVTHWALDGATLAVSADSFNRGTIILASTSTTDQLPPLAGQYIVSTYGNHSLTSLIWQTALHGTTGTLFTRVVNKVGWQQNATTDAIANIPSVPKSVPYVVTAADKGASIDTTSNVTIPASVFEVGDVIVVTNTSASSVSITPAAGVTIRLAGTASTGARTLAVYGVATLRMVSNNVWFASGAGLS